MLSAGMLMLNYVIYFEENSKFKLKNMNPEDPALRCPPDVTKPCINQVQGKNLNYVIYVEENSKI
jgi:hypothetical protein